jgi:hypothetical protein
MFWEIARRLYFRYSVSFPAHHSLIVYFAVMEAKARSVCSICSSVIAIAKRAAENTMNRYFTARNRSAAEVAAVSMGPL